MIIQILLSILLYSSFIAYFIFYSKLYKSFLTKVFKLEYERDRYNKTSLLKIISFSSYFLLIFMPLIFRHFIQLPYVVEAYTIVWISLGYLINNYIKVIRHALDIIYVPIFNTPTEVNYLIAEIYYLKGNYYFHCKLPNCKFLIK